MQTPEGFRTLADLLRPHQEAPQQSEPIDATEDREPPGEADAARDVRLLRARISEALDSAVTTLCEDIASEVVGRELQLAPAEIAAIVRRAVERHETEGIARVRVHPEDAAAFPAGAICGDPSLRRGDAVLELSCGAIDASLGVRLDSVLRSFR